MIHGYHLIFGTYGFWLPNDPRGSWSDFVNSWELARFGKATKSAERSDVDVDQLAQWRLAAQRTLKYPSVVLSDIQIKAVGTGFGNSVQKSGLTVWACSILPQHVHLVVARHTYSAEQMVNLLKGEATKSMKSQAIHPLQTCADSKGKVPTMWAEGQWIVYLDSEPAIESAIHYVEENPLKEGAPQQQWPFVSPFSGLGGGGWMTYH